MASGPSAAAAAGAAAAALLQRQLLQGSGEGWSEHQTGDGRKFFHNEETGVSQWEKPDTLMSESERIVNSADWKQYRIWDGRIFYYNKETKVSCWSMPPELRKLRGESTGLDDRPLAETGAERRHAFQDFLKQKGVDATWDWRRVQSLAREAPQAQGLSEQIQKQVFAEVLSMELRKKEIQVRAKARNAAVALERLLEERFSEPEALGTTYQEAANILGDEEAWILIKSDVRREEVFQNVMERLEDKHQKARAEKRTERVVRLQRLMATDPDLKRPRTRWKDAAAVLARRDELQEEDPPIEALRVWVSMRELRLASTKEVDLKSKVQSDFYRDERKRRDAFVLAMKEVAAAERLTVDSVWAQVEEQLGHDQRFMGMREGEGATAMELFDEFIEELRLKGPEAYAGVEPAPPPPVVQEPAPKRRRTSRLSDDVAHMPVKQELHPAVKMEKEEDEDDTNALDALIAAAGVNTGVGPVKSEIQKKTLQPSSKAQAVKVEPICPSAFTRSHHCRGHINSVHKFFKCACSALFTSEEAFERHKELHPPVFPEQADGEETPPEVSGSARKDSAQKDNTQEDNELHEKNLKLDVANQLLELHKIMQHRSSPSNTTGSGSETLSDSGDEGNSNNHSKQSPPSSEVKPVRPQPAPAVSPVLRYQNDLNRQSPNMSHMEQASIIPPKITSEGVEFHVPQARYSYSSQPNPQGVDYLRLPFQSINLAGNGKSSPERTGHVRVPSPERRKSPVDQSINGIHSAVYDVPQHTQCMPHFVMNVDPQSQKGNYSNFIENSLRAANSSKGSVEVSKTAESINTVPCHRVSVIQYHSSSQKPPHDARSEESSVQGTLQECDYKLSTLALSKPASRTLVNQSGTDQPQNHHVPQNYNLSLNNIKHLVGIPPGRIPYVPRNAESAMTLQSWSKEMNEQVGKYPWALKEEKNTHEQFLMRDPAMQFSFPKLSLESNQLDIFSQANAQSSTSLYNVQTSQERSVDMLKYLAREQIKPNDAERDTGSPPGDDDSETSEASESGDVPNERKLSGSGGQPSPSSDSLVDQKDSSDSSVHHCEVCKKTFSRSSLLKQHSVIHMGNKRFKFRCEVCGKMFRTRSHLRDHMRIHTGERPFKCHICQKAFKQSSDLKKHINLHTGANQFKCEECNMEFRRADALRKHKLGHKVGNMPCGHCGKNFLHIGALRAHRAMHNVQPVKASRSFHRCNYCFKTFTKAESYKVHIEEHTREQGGAVVLFDCKICSMKFFTEAEFQDHMNIHNGNRPYKCFVCDKEFCIAEHLQDHVRLHSDATARVRCEEGSNRFQMPDDLIRHSAIHA